MNNWMKIIAGVFVAGMAGGCTVMSVEDHEYVLDDEYYVDAYVAIPYTVRVLIADCIDGYAMPPVSRYGYEIYPVDRNDPYNLPSYVSADFNGDDIYDYAYMFSQVTWRGDTWFCKTKMLVVVSTFDGFELSSEIILGTVSGDSRTPVEEYWGIRLLERGTHVIETYDHGITREERITLENDGIYLASIDPEERSVFYSSGTDMYEIVMDMGAVAKKRVTADTARASRILKLTRPTSVSSTVQN